MSCRPRSLSRYTTASEPFEGGVAMTTMTKHEGPNAYQAIEDTPRPTVNPSGVAITTRLNSEQVWDAISKGSFAVISYETPTGEPRSSGVMYKVLGHRLYVVVAPDSWKARHIAQNPDVAVTVLVRRGGVLSLVFPIPPATISFHGEALVYAGNAPGGTRDRRADGKPAPRRTTNVVVDRGDHSRGPVRDLRDRSVLERDARSETGSRLRAR